MVVVTDKPKTHRLGDLQLRILQQLWERAEASVPEIHKAVSARAELAYTTVATMLRKMEERGLVAHRVEERKFIYRAQVKEQDVTRNMSSHLMERLFEGSLSDMVCHLLDTRRVSRDELDRLEKLIAERKKKL